MLRLKMSNHAANKAKKRFCWSRGKAKAYFMQKFQLNEVPIGRRSVLDDGGVVWVVANDGHTVTIITLYLR